MPQFPQSECWRWAGWHRIEKIGIRWTSRPVEFNSLFSKMFSKLTEQVLMKITLHQTIKNTNLFNSPASFFHIFLLSLGFLYKMAVFIKIRLGIRQADSFLARSKCIKKWINIDIRK